jgi:hypothetical protein
MRIQEAKNTGLQQVQSNMNNQKVFLLQYHSLYSKEGFL